MQADYKRLWKLLIDRNMKKKELRDTAHLSPSLMTKLNRNESLTTNTLSRICEVLNCRIEDIMEFVPDKENDIDSMNDKRVKKISK